MSTGVTLQVVVVGQGYVGLPLALAATAAGHDVVGVDADPGRVTILTEGHSPVVDVTENELRAALDSGRFRVATGADAVADADVVVLCVPTPYKNEAPDLSYVEAAGNDVGRHLAQGALVILESTTYPGTTEEVLVPILEKASGLSAGIDFDVAFSPERIDPGNPDYGIHNTPKIVGGLTPAATERAAAFYGTFVDHVVTVSGPKTAEMAKVLENTFRHINIALVNELAILCQDLGVDVWEVIDAAASKPFGFMPFYPGPGVGGHCIPVDPMYLSWRVRQFGGAAKFIDLARDVNAAMPAYCVSRVQDLLNEHGLALKGARIVVLGVAYKSNVADVRESPALPLLDGLRAKGAEVAYHDPHIDSVTLADGAVLESVGLDDAIVSSADCVILVTRHDLVDHDAVARRVPLVFDTRNAIHPGPNVHRL